MLSQHFFRILIISENELINYHNHLFIRDLRILLLKLYHQLHHLPASMTYEHRCKVTDRLLLHHSSGRTSKQDQLPNYRID